MNQSEKRILASKDWPFLEKEDKSLVTVANQQNYNMPQINGKFKSMYITVSNFRWVPRLITLRDEWDRINLVSYTADIPLFFYIFGGQVWIWPTPATSGNGIGLIYKKIVKDLTLADYITGSITTATNGTRQIVATGTAFTQQMGGRYLRITDSNSANTGDGFWYEVNNLISIFTITIATPAVITATNHGLVANDVINFTTTGALPTGLSTGTNYYVLSTGLTANAFQVSASAGGAAINTSGVQSGVHTILNISATTLSLVRNYTGNSIASGTAVYTLGQMSAFPEGYTDLPVWDAARQYFATVSPDKTKFELYNGLFKGLYQQMDDEQSDKQASPVLDSGESPYVIVNPNLLISNTGP